jgi:DNA-binding CsgD family transcriptional regulator
MTTFRSTEYRQELGWSMGKVATVEPQEARSRLSSAGLTAAGRRILSELSTEESSVVCFLLEEGTNRAIADRMGTSVQTVKNHLLRIFQKVGVDDRLSLAMALIRHGVVECPCGRHARSFGVPSVAAHASEHRSHNA